MRMQTPPTPDPLYPLPYTCVHTAFGDEFRDDSMRSLSVWGDILMTPGAATDPTRCIMSYGRHCQSCITEWAGQTVY
jgi:hypothetical protein